MASSIQQRTLDAIEQVAETHHLTMAIDAAWANTGYLMFFDTKEHMVWKVSYDFQNGNASFRTHGVQMGPANADRHHVDWNRVNALTDLKIWFRDQFTDRRHTVVRRALAERRGS